MKIGDTMKQFDIKIDEEHFSYLDSIVLNDKNYVAYMGNDSIFVSEYTIDNGQIIFKDIDDEQYEKVIKELSL